jgi:type VI secretion system protein ImpF
VEPQDERRFVRSLSVFDPLEPESGKALPLSFFEVTVHRFPPYLFDRLTDDPGSPKDGVRMTLSVRELERTVVQDLEALLNTRRTVDAALLDAHPHARQSVLGYGLEDFSSLSVSGSNDRDRICRRLEAAIVTHEPRLKRVQVTIDANSSSAQQLRFSIKALLCVSPLQEPVDFDAVLDATTQHYDITAKREPR